MTATAPTLVCSGCSRTFRIGEDAVAVALEHAYGLVSKTVVVSDGRSSEREDLVDTLDDAAPENLEGARELARQNWKVIQDSLARGESRIWRCRACEKSNSYPKTVPQTAAGNQVVRDSGVNKVLERQVLEATGAVDNKVVQARGVTKVFKRDAFEVTALDNVTIDIAAGEFLALMGPSGSGKTTLLNMIAAIDRPTGGELRVLGDNIFTLNDAQSARWRNTHVGYVFQTFNLIPVLTAFENVELPLLLTKMTPQQRRDHVLTALKLVGLEDRVNHLPKQLSGGQEQRVAIARAIVSDPTLILADEPTGDLDSHSATEILEILKRLNEGFKKTIVMVTHDPHAAQYAHVTRHLEKGRLLPN